MLTIVKMFSRTLLTFGCGIVAISALSSFQSKSAIAELHPTKDSKVHGKVTFTSVETGGVRIVADIDGLAPGKHGFHIHEHGDCSAADASSAGGHFNPDNKPHGALDATSRHVGDLGNVEADAKGHAHYELVDAVITLEGAHSIIGRAVIVHEKADDFTTQPTGNAGSKLACGVIVEQK